MTPVQVQSVVLLLVCRTLFEVPETRQTETFILGGAHGLMSGTDQKEMRCLARQVEAELWKKQSKAGGGSTREGAPGREHLRRSIEEEHEGGSRNSMCFFQKWCKNLTKSVWVM